MTANAALRTAALAYYPLAILLGVVVVAASVERGRCLARAAALQTLGSKASYAGRSVLETLSFGWYAGASETAADYEGAVARAATCGRWGGLAGWLLAAATAGFAWLVRRAGRSAADGWRSAARHLCLVGLVLFAVGVSATALDLVAAREITGIGRVILAFESKSILSTIRDLLASHQAVLGLLVLVFSIVVPLVKAALTLFAAATHGRARDRAAHAVSAVGKWSMADVFVIAVLLAMLALGRDAATRATTGPGLWFFAASCLVSLWATSWLPTRWTP